MSGQNKNQEVLAAIKASLQVNAAQVKEKRIAWKTAFTKAKDVYLAAFDATTASTFGYSLEKERNDAFKHAFTKLHDAVGRDAEKWGDRADDIPVMISDAADAYLKSMCQRAADAPEDSLIVRELQSGQQDALGRVYAGYRDYFLGFAGNQFPKATIDAVTDVYQDAWIVLIKYINDQKIRIVADGKNGELLIGLRNKATIKTLLTAIGSNMLKKDAGDDLLVSTPEPDLNLPDLDVALSTFSEEDHSLLYKALESLGEKCQFLLACRYWIKLPYKDIQDWTDAPSEEALRTQQSRCLKYLIKAFNKLRGKE